MLLQPAKSDIVVTRKRGGSREQYVIRPVAGPDQLQMFGRENAIAHALAFARFARLCVWVSEDGMGPVLIGNFRDVAPVVMMATGRPWRPVAI